MATVELKITRDANINIKNGRVIISGVVAGTVKINKGVTMKGGVVLFDGDTISFGVKNETTIT